MDFDVIPYEDITWGKKLGSGSFGSVYKGSYLGIDIAIKEVLPSTEYDVHKYFEREWRIMRECRHPNVVLFLGLSRAPIDDGRVFIVSEFLPRGNLRQFILSAHPFPWGLRLSFATDVARAVAYLHARQCIHRDLKGENLLITANERIKVTDFGFARISSRNAEEMRRMTYCGTDGYMSPEILNGLDFDLPTDVFSLGMIIIEILSRRLVDSKTFTRAAPAFIPDPDEVRRRAAVGCPPGLIELALHCTKEDPLSRPKMPEILQRLREIEIEVLSRLDFDHGEHVGSIKLLHHSGKRAMPVFDNPPEEVRRRVSLDGEGNVNVLEVDDDDVKMEEDALRTLAGLRIEGKGADGGLPVDDDGKGGTWRTARWEERGSVHSNYATASEMRAHQRLIPSTDTASSFHSGQDITDSAYSTDVIRAKPLQHTSNLHAAIPFPVQNDEEEDIQSSVLTVRGISTVANSEPDSDVGAEQSELPSQSKIGTIPSLASNSAFLIGREGEDIAMASAIAGGGGGGRMEESVKIRIPTKHEIARNNAIGTHRFTLVGKDTTASPAGKKVSNFTSHFAFAFLPKSLGKSDKCPVCFRRLGQRAALQCDDCGIVVHVKCSHAAPRNCVLTDSGGTASPPSDIE